jgi:hypothetical protein
VRRPRCRARRRRGHARRSSSSKRRRLWAPLRRAAWGPCLPLWRAQLWGRRFCASAVPRLPPPPRRWRLCWATRSRTRACACATPSTWRAATAAAPRRPRRRIERDAPIRRRRAVHRCRRRCRRWAPRATALHAQACPLRLRARRCAGPARPRRVARRVLRLHFARLCQRRCRRSPCPRCRPRRRCLLRLLFRAVRRLLLCLPLRRAEPRRRTPAALRPRRRRRRLRLGQCHPAGGGIAATASRKLSRRCATWRLLPQKLRSAP